MSYRDEWVTCDQCGRQFVFPIEDQRRQAGLGFEIEKPDLCPQCRQAVPPRPGLQPGFVKWYQEDKAFGFITQRDGSEIFFHRSGVEGDPVQVLVENAPVWYEVKATDRGPQAVNVHYRA